MKLNKRYLIETILEAMEEEKTTWSSAEDLQDWLEKQVIEGLRQMKTGKGNFDFERFKWVAEFSDTRDDAAVLRLGEKRDVTIDSLVRNMKQKQKAVLVKGGRWVPGAYEWEQKCTEWGTEYPNPEKKCEVIRGRWVFNPNIKKFAKEWRSKFQRNRDEHGWLSDLPSWLRESAEETDFQKIMRLVSTDLAHAKQAMQLVDFMELSADEEKQLQPAYAKAIIKDSPTPLLDLQAIDYDFHQVFEDIFEVRPPGQKFVFHKEREDLVIDLSEKIFLGIDISHEGVIEPFIYAEVPVGKGRVDQMGFYPEWTDDGKKNIVPTGDMIIKHDIYKEEERDYISNDLEVGVSVSKLPSILGAWPELDLSTLWPELPKGQPRAKGSDIEGPVAPPFEGKRKLNKSYLMETIAEVMSEMGENFSGTPDGGLLHEAWDSNWPSHFEGLKLEIKSWTTKGKKAEQILSKYAFEAMPFRFLRATSSYRDEGIWNAYISVFEAFVDKYVKEAGLDQKKEHAFLNRGLSDDARDAWYDQFMEARVYKGKEAGLKALNKMASSLSKQIRKFWISLEDEGVDWPNVAEEFETEVSKKIQGLQFQEAGLITSRILEIIEFVNADQGDDNTKKLTAFYKKIKKAAASDTIDVQAIVDEVDIIKQTKLWVDDEQLKLDLTPCEDEDADWDAPCVQHKFDDGFFWYDIKAGSCEISGRKLNNCGQASTAGGSLYNLMSYTETGKPRWHVMVEYNADTRTIVQVLGNSNTVPKEEYWSHIKWLWEDFQKPLIEKGAWEHVQGEDIKNKVYKFLKFIGLKSDSALTDSWNQLVTQIDDGFYSVKSYESDYAPTGEDFARLTWIGGSNYVNMSVRIRKRLIEPKAGTNQFDYEHIRDFKAAARAMNNSNELYSILERIIPEEREELFDKNEITQRVRFSHGGILMLHLNWTTKVLQNLDGGRYGDADYRNQLQRETLVAFMQETQQNFTVKAMYAVATYLGDKVEEAADEHAMSRAAHDRGDDLDELLDISEQTEILQENEGEEEDDNYGMIAGKVEKFIGSKDFQYYTQAFHLIDVYDMSDLITQEEANELRKKIFYAAFEYKLAHENLDEMKGMIDEFHGISKEDRLDMEWDIYYHLSFVKSPKEAVEYAIKDFDVKVVDMGSDMLLALQGVDQEELEKAKERLIRFGEEEDMFAPDTETGDLLFGSLAEKFVSLEKKIEEIFGATPRGDIDVSADALSVLIREKLPGTFKAPMVDNQEMTANIAFEWSVELDYGMEITLYPPKLPNHPGILDEYYGVWVNQIDEGPQIGKLRIGIQSYEDEMEENEDVKNDSGREGFTKEEMKKKILELTGIDLNALN